jgi:1-acyl-sn-glycerol-3-phosphate acyltransferase
MSRLRVETHYKTKLDLSKPYIFVANHQSMIDIPIAALAVPCPFGFAAKIELAKIPFLGHAIKYSPSVFLDRSNPRAALASIKRAGESIRAGTSIIIYVEGGRSFQKTLGEFKKGAFLLAIEAGVPLVPLVIQDSCMLVNQRIGEARRGTAHVIVGEPISLEGVGRKDVKELMSRVKSVIQHELESDFPSMPVEHHNA